MLLKQKCERVHILVKLQVDQQLSERDQYEVLQYAVIYLLQTRKNNLKVQMTAKRFSQRPTNVVQLLKSELLFTLSFISVNISCTANVLCPIWQDGFVHFRPLGFQTPGFSSSFFLLATAFIATSSLNAKGIFFLFFLYSSFIVLLYSNLIHFLQPNIFTPSLARSHPQQLKPFKYSSFL